MKSAIVAGSALVGAALGAGIQGFDISNYQETVDYKGAYDSGARFVMIKASEGNDFKDKSFDKHYAGASDAKLYRGGYHFATPDAGSGAAQAKHFLASGGGWSDDGQTLPGMLDMETNPYGDKCYGLSADAMVAWIQEFSDTYKAEAGREPMIYTSPDWWSSCAGDSTAFSKTCPLVVAAWSSSPPTPSGWEQYTIWQNADTYEFGGDSDLFNGDEDGLTKFVKGG